MHIHSWPLFYLRIRGHENIGLPIALSVPRGLEEIPNVQAYSEIASDPPRRAVSAHPLELHIANLFLPVEGMFMSWAHDLRKQKSYTLVHLRLTK